MDTLIESDRRARSIGRRWIGLRVGGLLRIGAALIFLACAATGAWLFMKSPGPSASDRPALDGTWDLYTINGERVGEHTAAEVVSQRIALRAGRVRGETVVQSASDVTNVAMPFPDESVDRAIANTDETGFRVLWNGSYQIDDRQQMTLRVGKAVYFIKMTWQPDRQGIEFNQDVILTLHGIAIYRRAVSSRQR